MPEHAQILDNPKSDRIKRLAELARPKGREKAQRFLIEGPQSVREALRCAADVVTDVYVVADGNAARPATDTLAEIVALAAPGRKKNGIRQWSNPDDQHRVYVHYVTPEVMTRISTDAQGIVAVADLEAFSEAALHIAKHDHALIAAFWQVRDPGNAGTVIRAADAAGCDGVIFVDECVDIYNPKVIRSTAGSLFHLPVRTMDTGKFLDWASKRGLRVWAADVYGYGDRQPESLPELLTDAQAVAEPKAVLFGNEARGLPQALLAETGRIVSIPLYGQAESLNLGTSAAVMLMSLAMARA